MNRLVAAFCVLALATLVNCDRIEGEIDLREEKGFDTSKYPKEYFLTPLPLSTIRSISYHVRHPNPFSINPIPKRPDTAYTKAYLHQINNNKTRGFVQFRQIVSAFRLLADHLLKLFCQFQSDMWLTEIKGVVESLQPNSSYLLVIHQNSVAAQDGDLCFDLGPPFHYAPLSESSLRDVRTRNALGDLGVFTSDRNGVGAVNLNAIYTSLFGGPGAIPGRSLAVSL